MRSFLLADKRRIDDPTPACARGGRCHVRGKETGPMVAKWTLTVAAALAWAGLAWGQQPAFAPTTLECPRVITVQELGKKPQRCRVLKTWREADGMVAFEVQAI